MNPTWLKASRQDPRSSAPAETPGRESRARLGPRRDRRSGPAAPLVLLTASIVPAVPTHVGAADPHLRLEDYVRSISRWAEFTDAEIVVVENTGSSDVLRARLDGWLKGWPERLRVEEALVPSHVVAQGKGASELFTVDAVLRRYEIRSDRCVVKASGRYIVSHPKVFLRSLDLEALNLRIGRRGLVDARLFAVPTWFMWDLVTRIDDLDDGRGYFLEHLLADLARSFAAQGVALQEPILGSLIARAGSRGSLHGGRLGRISAYLRLASSIGRRWVR